MTSEEGCGKLRPALFHLSSRCSHMTDLLNPHGVIKAALFVDFDNIYIGLKKIDQTAAEEFATNPARWLTWFEHGMQDGGADISTSVMGRAVLLRRCYLNPTSFANYRSYFTRSAFTVVDCPPLTQQGKNSADIFMVMDILDTLRLDTRFDEFIILSGDTDFTPVLLRLRIHDRRTIILTPGPVAQPYKAASDHAIGIDVFIEGGLGISEDDDVQPNTTEGPPLRVNEALLLDAMAQRVYEKVVAAGDVSALDLPQVFKEFPEFKNSDWLGFYSLRNLTTELTHRRPELCIIEGEPAWRVALQVTTQAQITSIEHSDDALVPDSTPLDASPSLRERIISRVNQLVADSMEPINLATAAYDVIRRVGSEVTETQWAWTGSFKNFLLSVENPDFKVFDEHPGYIWDPKRHKEPERHKEPASASFSEKWDGFPTEMASFARRINRVTGAPLLTPNEYALVFRILEDELKNHSYSLYSMSKAIRDRCIEKGVPLPRKAVNFILQGITYAGHIFEENPLSDTATTFAEVFKENILALCRGAQLELTDKERTYINSWLSVTD